MMTAMLSCSESQEWGRKMGAMKELFGEISTCTYQIGQMLNQASESGDIEQLTDALRSAITNSALTLAFIAELESK
jgi:hypothetical protein